MSKLRSMLFGITAFLFLSPAVIFAQQDSVQTNETEHEMQQTEENTQTGQTGNVMDEQTSQSQNQQPINLKDQDQDPSDEIVAKFKPIAEEHANLLRDKLGLDEGDTEDIRESLMDYFDDIWESRVELDQEADDTEEVRENEEDLADERVEVVSEIEDELTDEQINQWKTFKVEWWTSLDQAINDLKQQVATGIMPDKNNNKDEQQ